MRILTKIKNSALSLMVAGAASTVLATGFTSLTPLTSQAQSFEIVEGVGFGETRSSSTRNAIRAWIRQARRDYPDSNANFNTALRSSISCEIEEQSASSGDYTSQGVGVEGNVDGAWSCYVRGVPADIFN